MRFSIMRFGSLPLVRVGPDHAQLSVMGSLATMEEIAEAALRRRAAWEARQKAFAQSSKGRRV